jgi:hypothetical protein
MSKNIISIVVIVFVGLVAWFLPQSEAKASPQTPCAVHQTANCPFCHPQLIQKMGLCKEHDNIPEAQCVLCRPELKRAYQQEKDWCAGHSVPESQCTTCLLHGHNH